MSSFLPIISEILPMIIPTSIHITRAKDLQPTYPVAERSAVSREAMVGVCDKMCASVLTMRPKSKTSVRHNSEQDAIIYAVSGSATLTIKQGFDDELRRHKLNPGDFAFVPAWTEHQGQNDSDTDATWVVTQSGTRPVGAILADWGGDETPAEG